MLRKIQRAHLKKNTVKEIRYWSSVMWRSASRLYNCAFSTINTQKCGEFYLGTRFKG
jgi:hypothetical protein